MRGGYYQETDETDLRVYNSVTNLVNVRVKDIFNEVNRDAVYIENIEDNNRIIKYIDLYKYIIIEYKDYKYAYVMTEEFKEAIKNLDEDFIIRSVIRECFGIAKKHTFITRIMLGASNKSSGGKKAVVKYTVKDLQAIAIENKIKITKKVEGKTVRLNKQGMIAKLKRYKLI